MSMQPFGLRTPNPGIPTVYEDLYEPRLKVQDESEVSTDLKDLRNRFRYRCE